MDSRQYRDLMEAYVEVYAPQEEIEEAVKGQSSETRRDMAAERRRGIKPLSAKEGEKYASHKLSQMAYAKRKRMGEEIEEYIDFLVDEGYDCSDLTWDEIFEEYESLDEGLRSAVKRLLGKKDAPAANKPMSRGDQLRKKYNVGPEKSDTSAKRQILNRTRAKAERDKEQYGGSVYTKSVADKSKAAHDRYLRGGYSKYGADDRRGSGNKARRRAAALKNEEFDLFDTILEFLYVEGYVDTLEEAEWMMANIIDEEAIDIILEASCEDDEDEKEMKKGKKSKKSEEDEEDENEEELEEASYSAKAARAGKDIGKPGKQFAKIAKEAGKRYGSKERGKKVAGAVLAKLRKENFESWLDEAMTKYEKNRKRAAQRAAARNAARDQGKTGAVPGVGYVTPRRERETWTDESGKTRHAKGL